MSKLLKDPLLRRFVSASCFAGAFVWVAVRYFNVETDVVWVLFIMSFVFVGVMMAAGLVLAPLVRFFRPDSPMLANMPEEEASSSRPPTETDQSAPQETPHKKGSE